MRPPLFAITGLVLAGCLLGLLLNLPPRIGAVLAPYHAPVALELMYVLAGLALFPWLRTVWFRHIIATLTLFLIFIRVGDLIAKTALDRYFNLYVDLKLSVSLVDLAVGTLGWLQGSLLILGALALLAGLYGLCCWWLGLAIRLTRQRGGRAAVLVLCFMFGGFYWAQLARPEAFGPVRIVAFKSPDLARLQWRLVEKAVRAEAQFQRSALTDPYKALPSHQLLSSLDGADVLLLFVESYGSSALQDPRYAPHIRPVLKELDVALARNNLHVVSGWLESPTVGGQSWLAHATTLSGLWLDSQLLYDLLLQSRRQTLAHYFKRAGYRTIAGMPAIVKDWPEAVFFGYQKIYTAAEFEYAGPAYNWVTMPDQYTLAYLQRTERTSLQRPPLFAEIALISSHAPWTPVADVLDWSQVGDGAVFARWAASGDPPDVIWRDPERLRRQYGLALAYTLKVVTSYAVQFTGRRTLLVVLGDHQPTPLITGPDAPRTVPIHVISGDPDLLRPFADWGLTPGVFPEAGVRRMDEFRDVVLNGFSEVRPKSAYAQRSTKP